MVKETTEKNKAPKKKWWKRRWLIALILLLVAIRLCLPFIILYYANKKLAALEGYYGHISDIDLALIRGAYTIDDIYIDKVNDAGEKTADFFKSKEIDLSVEWAAIFDGKIVGEVEFLDPVLIYTMDETVGKKADADADSTNFIQLVKDFMPLDINRFATRNGEVHYVDNTRSPKVDLPMTEVDIEGKGLTNKPAEGVVLPATIDMNAALYNGNVDIGVKLDPLNDLPTFDLNGELTKTDLKFLNPFFKAYAKFDVEAGTMAMYTEVAAKDGEFSGYVKPLIEDMKVVEFSKEEGNLPQIAWEAFVGGVAKIFTNMRTDQLATKVDMKGKFSDPKVKVWDAIIALIKNAFVKAIEPSIENSINLANVDEENIEKKGFLKRVFGKDDKPEEDNKNQTNDKAERKKSKKKKDREDQQ